MKQRYHIKLGDRRTTVSLDNTLSNLVAIKLNTSPETKEAHQATRTKLQEWLDEPNDPDRIHVSQWLAGRAVEFIADKILSQKYDEWILSTD